MSEYLFEIGCMDGLESLATHRALPLDLFRRFSKFLDLYDESAKFFLGQLRRSGLKVQCRPECFHCCPLV
jgi:hypothetical protein